MNHRLPSILFILLWTGLIGVQTVHAQQVYRVQPGDTLSALAYKFRAEQIKKDPSQKQHFIDQVMAMNPDHFPDANPHRIRVGMSLRLPGSRPAAHIETLDGQAWVVNEQGQLQEVNAGQALYPGDRVLTREQGYVLIQFRDGSSLALKENSRVLIEKFSWDASSNQGFSIIRFLQGAFRAISGSIASSEPDNYQVITGVGTLGVRGTVFGARLCAENSCVSPKANGQGDFLSAGTYIGVLQGRIVSTNGAIKTRVAAGRAIYQKDNTSEPVSVDNIPGLIFSAEEFELYAEEPSADKPKPFYPAFWLDRNGQVMRHIDGTCIRSMDYRDDHHVVECQ